MNKIQQFIADNSLSLEGTGSELNSTLCTITGYALYVNGDKNEFEKLLEDIEEDGLYDLTSDVSSELERIFDFAYSHNYVDWWKDEHAHSIYTFE